jgi:Homeodomain-like domain
MAVASEFAQLQLRFVDQVQWRYELIRPLVLLEERPAPPEAIRQRAHATGSHPETVRKCTRRFEQQGLLGLLPEAVGLIPKASTPRVPSEVLEESGRLKALYEGFEYQELVRIVLCPCGYQLTDKTAKRLWQQSPTAPQGALPLGDYHSYPDRAEARREVLKLYAQGWNKLSISRVLHVSRPTVDRWIHRFEAEDLEPIPIGQLVDT